MRSLRRARPGIDVAQRVMATFVLERTVLRPGSGDEVDRFPELLARGGGRDIVVEGLRPRAGRESGDQSPIRHVVEHRVFLGDAQRREVEWKKAPENDDLAALGLLT